MPKRTNTLLLLCLATLCGATVASAAPVPYTFGKGIWRLQELVDARYGPHRIDVRRDYLGAHAGDIDPWFWVGDRIGSVYVKMVKRSPDGGRMGWYLEGSPPIAPPAGGSMLFSGQIRPPEEAVVTMPSARTCFGFYFDSYNAVGGPKRFFTDRKLNDCGPDGTGAIHAPFDGDIQALVFDVSRWAGADTWLVCFEDQDTGGSLKGGEDDEGDDPGNDGGNGRGRGRGHRFDTGDDDEDASQPAIDFADVVFEVRALGATQARSLSFGALKLIYR